MWTSNHVPGMSQKLGICRIQSKGNVGNQHFSLKNPTKAIWTSFCHPDIIHLTGRIRVPFRRDLRSQSNSRPAVGSFGAQNQHGIAVLLHMGGGHWDIQQRSINIDGETVNHSKMTQPSYTCRVGRCWEDSNFDIA